VWSSHSKRALTRRKSASLSKPPTFAASGNNRRPQTGNKQDNRPPTDELHSLRSQGAAQVVVGRGLPTPAPTPARPPARWRKPGRVGLRAREPGRATAARVLVLVGVASVMGREGGRAHPARLNRVPLAAFAAIGQASPEIQSAETMIDSQSMLKSSHSGIAYVPPD
jgi:hypothetical protein